MAEITIVVITIIFVMNIIIINLPLQITLVVVHVRFLALQVVGPGI